MRMAILKRAGAVVAVVVSLGCTSLRQHSDYWTNGGGGGGGGAGGSFGGSGGSGGSAGGVGGDADGGVAGAVKKPDGEPCSAAAQCATGVCGGRCCAAGCTCTLPSAGNLLKDPGIDVDVKSWTASIGTINRALYDVEKCPYSGSLAATGESEQVISQCVSNKPLVGAFNFGARYKFESTGTAPQYPICQVTFYSGFNCDADIVLTAETDPPTASGDWQPIAGVIAGLAAANSVAFNCYLFPSSGVTYYLDMFYVSKAPATF
jgi:hypothetical protein